MSLVFPAIAANALKDPFGCKFVICVFGVFVAEDPGLVEPVLVLPVVVPVMPEMPEAALPAIDPGGTDPDDGAIGC